MESDADQLIEKLQRAYVRIKWLEDELLRLKMLLAGDDSMCNSLSHPKPQDDVEK